MKHHRQPCICVYATHGHREARVLEHPGCPEHGDGSGDGMRVVEVPGWLLKRLREAAGEEVAA